MTRLTRLLFGFCIRNRISLLPLWIPGVEMVACGVDGLSRPAPPLPLSSRDHAEWRLAPAWFRWLEQQLIYRCGIPALTCDRFASRTSAQLPRFCSRGCELGALSPPSAFAHAWCTAPDGSPEYNYAFPPAALAARVMQFAIQQRCWAVVVAPHWVRMWYPALLSSASLALDFPGEGHFERLQGGEWQLVERRLFRPVAFVFAQASSA